LSILSTPVNKQEKRTTAEHVNKRINRKTKKNADRITCRVNNKGSVYPTTEQISKRKTVRRKTRFQLCSAIKMSVAGLLTGSVIQWSSSRWHTQRFRVRFPALPDFLRSSWSGTGSTPSCKDNWRATGKKKQWLRTRRARFGGPQSRSGHCGVEKNLSRGVSNPSHPACNPRYTGWAVLATLFCH
jgi:hypothetical protein